MNRGSTLRTRLVQMEVLPGRPVDNTAGMLRAIAQARADGVELVAFPEMAVPGYLLGDEWERTAFLRECEDCGHELREAARGIIVIFGNVGLDWKKSNEDGRVRKYNACFVAEDGRFLRPAGGAYDFVSKTLLPNYREFDDSRHFFDTRKLAAEQGRPLAELLAPVPTSRAALGCILCEDAWHLDYGLSPAKMLAEAGADLIVNLSCSPFTLNKNHKRNRVFSALAVECGVPLCYVNNVGIQDNGKTVYTFDGACAIYDSRGNQVTGIPAFEEGALTQDVPLARGTAFGAPVDLRDDGTADLYRAVRYGTGQFLRRCGLERIVIGISGGIDSSLAAALHSTLLEPDRLLLVSMPSRHNSATTRNAARELAAHAGCLYTEVSIEDSVASTVRQLDNLELRDGAGAARGRIRLTDFVLENVQARDRSARILAALAAAFGGAFTCNANKSEVTVGYTTLYGDLGGYLAGLADLWKGEVRELAAYMNREIFGRAWIPRASMDVVPSAELSETQNVDEGRGDPLIYPYHDRLFASWVEWWNRATPEDNLEWYAAGELERKLGYDGRVGELFPDAPAFIRDLERWWSQYQGMGIAKRIQAPPVLAVKRRAFGFDHREAQLGPRYTRRYAALKRRLLTSPAT